MQTIAEQIAALTTLEITALNNALTINFTRNGVTVVYAAGTEVLACINSVYSSWYVDDLKISLPLYHARNQTQISDFLTAFYIDMTKQVDEHSETVSDIAPATITQYTTTPTEKETIKKAPFDSTTTKTDTERETSVNNGVEYTSGKAVTTYDTTGINHTSKVVTDKTGTNYPISKILTEEENRRFTDYLVKYLGVYVAEYGYRIGGVF